MEKIEIRSISTEDVKIAQKALEKIGFETIKEGDAVDAYWIELRVPKEFEHGKAKIQPLIGSITKEEKEIEW